MRESGVQGEGGGPGPHSLEESVIYYAQQPGENQISFKPEICVVRKRKCALSQNC